MGESSQKKLIALQSSSKIWTWTVRQSAEPLVKVVTVMVSPVAIHGLVVTAPAAVGLTARTSAEAETGVRSHAATPSTTKIDCLISRSK